MRPLPPPDAVARYAELAGAGLGLLERLAALVDQSPQARASRLRRRALRKLRRADRLLARRAPRARAVRREAETLLAEAEALWPIDLEIAALTPGTAPGAT